MSTQQPPPGTNRVHPEEGARHNLRLNIPLAASLAAPDGTSSSSTTSASPYQQHHQWNSASNNGGGGSGAEAARRSSNSSNSSSLHTPSPSSRRASIISRPASAVVSKLHIEKDEEGLTVYGFVFSSYCYFFLLVMSGFFIVVGAVLTIISFLPKDDEESKPSIANRLTGPIFILVGVLMFCAGLVLCLINWKMNRDERELHYRHLGSRPQSRKWSRSKSLSDPFMPTISQGLSFGLANTPAVPVVVNYPLLWNVSTIRGTALLLPPDEARRAAASGSLQASPERPSSPKGMGRRSSYPVTMMAGPPMDAAAGAQRRMSMMGAVPGGRRGSIKGAVILKEAKQELRELQSSSSPSMLVSSSGSRASSSTSVDGRGRGGGRRRSRDVACFPAAKSSTDTTDDRMVHGHMLDIPEEGDALPEIHITGSVTPVRASRKVHFTIEDGHHNKS